eukprot:9418456-Pyramimonas_sp.AAC.1
MRIQPDPSYIKNTVASSRSVSRSCVRYGGSVYGRSAECSRHATTEEDGAMARGWISMRRESRA